MSEPKIVKVVCNECDKRIPVNEAVEDEYKGRYFCDEGCFDDFASDNMDEVIEYYKEFNVY